MMLWCDDKKVGDMGRIYSPADVRHSNRRHRWNTRMEDLRLRQREKTSFEDIDGKHRWNTQIEEAGRRHS